MGARRGDVFLSVMGVVYLIFSVVAIFNAFYYGRPYDIFWFCYIGIFIIGIGLIGHERALVQSQLYILFIPDVVWTLDFFWYAFSGSSLFGITDYFFTPGLASSRIVSLQHLTTVPLGAYFFMRRGVARSPLWLASMLELVLLFGFTRLFTEAEQNVNCAFRACGNLPQGEPFVLWWLGATVLMVYLVHRLVLATFEVKQAVPRR